MRTTEEDPRSKEDASVLRGFRKTCVLDYIQWQDDDLSFAAKQSSTADWTDRHHYRGHRSTLHDVRLKDLRELPEAVKARPLAGLELSLDLFVPGGEHLSEEAHLRLLWMGFDVLARRLAPWRNDASCERCYAIYGKLDTVVTRGHATRPPKIRIDPSGAEVLDIYDIEPKQLLPPQRDGDHVKSTLLYFGNQPRPAWGKRLHQVKGQAQVRLYIKTIDKKLELPRQSWRLRVEVTMNAPAVAEFIPNARVGALLTARFTKIGMKYFALCMPKVCEREAIKYRKAHGGRRKPTVLQAMVRDKVTSIVKRGIKLANELGNLYSLNSGGVKFAGLAVLHRQMAGALGDFHKRARGASVAAKPINAGRSLT